MDLSSDRRKYNYMEETLKSINARYIALDPEDTHLNNGIILNILKTFVAEMKELDPLFKLLYLKPFYGGSFYDNLKVNSPDEFDLDLLFVLPKCKSCRSSCRCIALVDSNNMPGFVNLRFDMAYYQMHQDVLRRIVNEGLYLDSSKTRSWMIGLVHKTLNSLNNKGLFLYQISYKTSGPAVTLVINGKIFVDFVPSFLFGKELWPNNGFRRCSFQETEFFIVPKSPKPHYCNDGNIWWRLSFQIQERALLRNCQRLKPVLRLLKKMRDTRRHHYICSYYLKTIAIWAVHEKSNEMFWKENSLSYIFIWMLQIYRDHLKNKEIQYFWNGRNNLLQDISGLTLENDYNRINRVICNIENSGGDHRLVAELILSPEEYRQFTRSYERDVRRDGPPHEAQNVENTNWKPIAAAAGIGVAVAAVGGLLYTFFSNSADNNANGENNNGRNGRDRRGDRR